MNLKPKRVTAYLPNFLNAYNPYKPTMKKLLPETAGPKRLWERNIENERKKQHHEWGKWKKKKDKGKNKSINREKSKVM